MLYQRLFKMSDNNYLIQIYGKLINDELFIVVIVEE